jgi:hypothetical protein
MSAVVLGLLLFEQQGGLLGYTGSHARLVIWSDSMVAIL